VNSRHLLEDLFLVVWSIACLVTAVSFGALLGWILGAILLPGLL